MAGSTKYDEFSGIAGDRLEQIKYSLLRHEKNPSDREFINDISRSVKAIRSAAMPVGLGKVSELCFHLGSALDIIRRNRLPIDPDTVSLLRDGRDRIAKLSHEISTSQKERATIKDLVKRLKDFEQSVIHDETMEPSPEVDVLQAAPTLAVTESPVAESEIETDLSLLPEEVRNEEYDQELFDIFLEQMQENISLLRSVVNRYPDEPNKGKAISLSSDLVSKLQNSANYMGYDKLADFYLQWIAELEMMGVEMTMGTSVPFDFMDENIQTVSALFNRVKDVEAGPDQIDKAWKDFVISAPEKKKPKKQARPPVQEDDFGDLFSDFDDDFDTFDTESDPIAALSDEDALIGDITEPGISTGKPSATPKKTVKPRVIEVDPAIIDAELQESEFDDEMFTIYIQQLQEQLSRLRTLINGYQEATNKSLVLEHCSALVGKMQSSANYMGYERLAEYHLQWIAELEMAGVELAMGNDVSFAFMDKKVAQVAALFPQVEDIPATTSEFDALMAEGPAPGDGADYRPAKTLPGIEADSMEDLFPPQDDEEPALSTEEEDAAEPLHADEAPSESDEDEDDFLAQLNKDFSALAESAGPQDQEEDEFDFLSGQFKEAEDEPFEFDEEPIAAMTEEDSLQADDDETKPDPSAEQAPFEEDVMEDLFAENAETAETDAASEVTASEPEAEVTAEIDAEEDIAGTIDDFFDEDEPESESELTDYEEQVQFEDEPVAPERRELYEKLSHALESLEAETPEETAALVEDETGPAEDLFGRLSAALDSTADSDVHDTAGTMDSVLEEILVSSDIPVEQPAPSLSGQKLALTGMMRPRLGIDAARIDELMAKIAELTASRASLSQLRTDMEQLRLHLLETEAVASDKLEPLREMTSRLGNTNLTLNRLAGDIRESMLDVRMTPIGQLFDLFRESVPDLARSAGKEVTLSIEGDETEVDHGSLEVVADSLLILLRNAIEHGLENPDDREKAGKDKVGTISLSAFPADNSIVLEVSDDGRGIEPARIKAAALAQEMFTGDDLYKMSDNELTRLIMAPGFSTRRDGKDSGPGLDKVKEIVQGLNGKVRINSFAGSGTTFKVTLPLLLPNFQALKLSDGQQTYAIPLSSVDEVIRGREDDLVRQDGQTLVEYRKDRIPTVSLPDIVSTAVPFEPDRRFFVVIISLDGKKTGLIVPEVLGLEDVSIRPLAEFIREQSGFSGGAIRGEGDILFIPDLPGMLQKTASRQASDTDHDEVASPASLWPGIGL